MAQDQIDIVQNHDHRAALAMPSTQNIEQIGGGALIDGAERLIEQQDRRILHQQPGEQSALELPGRQRADRPPAEIEDAHGRQRRIGRMAHPVGNIPKGAGAWPMAKRHRVAAGYRKATVELGRLRQQSDFSTRSLEVDSAGMGRVQPGDGTQQRGLAGAVGSGDGGQATGRKCSRHAGHRDLAGMAQHDVGDDDRGRRHTRIQATIAQTPATSMPATASRARNDAVGESGSIMSYNITKCLTTGNGGCARRTPGDYNAPHPMLRAMTEPRLANQAPNDQPARLALARHRRFATGLVVLMAVIALGTYALPWPGAWPVELLQAAAKAGFVGGIADWFAVTALFRHPLGIPIPHTAIIATQKVRLGRALGRFVANHVVTEREVATVLARLDIPAILRRFLSDPSASGSAAVALAGMLPKLLATVEDGRARRVVARVIPRLLGGPGSGRVVARALHVLVAGGRHQEVFDFVLGQVKALLASKQDSVRLVIEERVREQGGRLVGWALGATVAERVLRSLNAELEKIGPDGSELREAFDEWVRREITRIEEDPTRAAEIGTAIRSVVGHETVQAWLWDVWARLRLAMEADAVKPAGRTVDFLESALVNLGAMLEQDPSVRARVQIASETIVMGLLPAAQAEIAEFIGGVVSQWDTETITDRLELSVGKDLQYVRINGTLVGFLVGGLVYGVLRLTFGHVSF